MNSVGGVGGNIVSGLDSVVGSALFVKLFPKTGRKRILFKARKRIQISGHMHFEKSYFLEFPMDI